MKKTRYIRFDICPTVVGTLTWGVRIAVGVYLCSVGEAEFEAPGICRDGARASRATLELRRKLGEDRRRIERSNIGQREWSQVFVCVPPVSALSFFASITNWAVR